jgi:hypothetical protein
MSPHDVIPFITAFAPYSWPATVLLLAWLFRTRIKDVIELKLGDKFYAKFVGFGQVSSDLSDPDPGQKQPRPATKQISPPSGTKWENVGSVFWLGGDLIWAAQAPLRGAPKEKILNALKQAYHHISDLGLADSAPARENFFAEI